MKNIEEILSVEIKKLMKDNSRIIIAIDGCSGVGKTTVASDLAQRFSANVFHMDDFFLPFNQRKSDSGEFDGNIDYQRFTNEVLIPLNKGEEVSYQKYNCQNESFSDPITVEVADINIIEGAYSYHPLLQSYYDFSIFLSLNAEEQIRRLSEREGPKRLEMFQKKWIPAEEAYFKHYKINKSVDLVCDIEIL